MNGPVLAGEYLQSVDLFTGPYEPVPQQQLNLAEGQQLELDIPINVTSAEEQVIPEGQGEPLNFATCFSDPAWVQPPFEDGYGKQYSFGQWPPEDQARAMYSRGIYISGLNQEWYIWATIAGLSDWVFTPSPGGCTPQQESSLTIDFAGYEPLNAVTAGDVTQVTLAGRDTGLYAIQLDTPYGGGQRWFLFVDESDRPLARCNGSGFQCEWFN